MRKVSGFCAAALVAITLLTSAAEADPRSFSVYFDWNDGSLKSSGTELLRGYVPDIHKNSRVTLTGHADTSEQDALAKIRADAVKEKLIALGVPGAAKFTVLSKGTKEPALETGPNVREPRNRFVAVVIR